MRALWLPRVLPRASHALALCLAAASTVYGDGMPDPAFGVDGRVQTTFGDSPDVAKGLYVQPDGFIVAAGFTLPGVSLAHMAIARYQSSGSPDPSFGVGGKTTVQYGINSSSVKAVLPQPGGRLLLVGAVDASGGRSVALVRLDPNGAEDPTFGVNGRVATVVPTGLANVLAASLQPDGRVVVFVSAGPGADWKPVVLRYNADGSLDATFGTGGMTAISIPNFLHAIRGDIAFQPDGRILLAGSNGTISTPSDPLVVRLLADGTPDPSFGTGGVLLADWGGSEVAAGVRVLGDGRLVVAGDRFVAGGTRDVVVARYLANGTLDTTFGTNGFTRADAGGQERAVAMAALPNGKLLVAASADADFLSVRFTEAGAVDTTFGTSGFLRTTFSASSTDAPETMALYGSDRFIVAGSSRVPSTDDDFALVRYLAVIPVELTGFAVE
jgi:uncharacterized delta-60 repeat protein